jgi:hypothetical protein
MKLAYTCPACLGENLLPKTFSDRFKVQLVYGNLYVSNCNKCSSLNKIEINRIYAKVNVTLLLTLFILVIFTSLYMAIKYYNLYINERSLSIGFRGIHIVAIAGFTPIFIWAVAFMAEQEKINAFNNHRI